MGRERNLGAGIDRRCYVFYNTLHVFNIMMGGVLDGGVLDGGIFCR